MKATAIQIKNCIGAIDVDLRLSRPITIVCGANHSGKSSVAQAVRMALTGEPSRVSLKKQYKSIVSDGADAGYAVVEHDGGQSAITLPNGMRECSANRQPSALLPLVLDAQRFAKLPENDRRQALVSLSGVSLTCHDISKRLVERGCDAAKVSTIATHLPVGYDSAHKEAQAKARDAKAAWRAITGETYGAVKAATWKAPKQERASDKLSPTREALGRIEAQIETNTGTLGDMKGRAKRAAEQAGKLTDLRSKASGYARIADKLARDESEMKQWQAKSEAVGSQGKSMKAEPHYPCPSCGTVLRHDHTNGALVEYTPPPPVDHEAAGKLREYQEAADLMARSVANGKRDLAAADAAAKALAELDCAGLVDAPNTGELDALNEATDELKQQRAELLKAIRELEDAERDADRADQRTTDAAKHHEDVRQWETIAASLAPDGIPGEIIGEAIAPVNDRMCASSNDTGWAQVAIDADMEITASGRPYALLSESEQWRSDAMIAEAIAHMSGERLLVLDRVDVLDIAGRDDLLFWLGGLAESGEINTCLLFATLKSLPENLPDGVEAVWIDGGVSKK